MNIKITYVPVLFCISLLIAPMALAGTRPSLANIQRQIDELQSEVTQNSEILDRLDVVELEVYVPSESFGQYDSAGGSWQGRTYFAGQGDIYGQQLELRNYFVFDLTNIYLDIFGEVHPPEFVLENFEIVSVDIIVISPGFTSEVTDTLVYEMNRVGGTFNIIEGSGGIESFIDLADGPGYGAYTVSSAFTNIQIRGSRAFVDDVRSRLEGPTDGGESPYGSDSRLIVTGGKVGPLDQLTGTEGLFLGSGGTTGAAATLAIKVKRPVFPD